MPDETRNNGAAHFAAFYLGCVVALMLMGLGLCEVYNKVVITKRLRPFIVTVTEEEY